MKISFFSIAIFLLLSTAAKSQAGNNRYDSLCTRMLTQTTMQEDFMYLRRALEETHPGLYRYNTKEQLNHTMDSLYALLNTDMKFYDYYRLLASLIAGIRCAHTNIVPSPDLQELLSKFKTFPYWVFTIDGHVYITGVATGDSMLKPGYELLSINGQSIDSIKQVIFSHLWTDGYIGIGKQRMLDEHFFALFYYLFVDQPGSFLIQCRTPGNKLIEHTAIAALLSDEQNNLMQNPVNKALLKAHGESNRLNSKNPWRVKIDKANNVAVMTILRFGGGKNGDEAAMKMRGFMDKSMHTIKKNNITNLVIDLRRNGGGWDNQGQELFTYLTDTPAYYYRKFHTVTDGSEFLQFSSVPKEELKNIKNELIPEGDGTFTVKEKYNSTLSIQHPKPNFFKGKIYFLADGASGSTTAEFLAVAHSNKLGTIIGEECAGNYTGGNGGEFISLTLPQTGIHVSIPLLYYENAVDTPLLKGRGTIPDYIVPYTIQDIIAGTDTQLNFMYNLVKNKMQNP